MSRLEMQNSIISVYGFEHAITIEFFEACEMLADTKENNTALEKICRKLLTNG